MVTLVTFSVFNLGLCFISKKGFFAKYRIQGDNRPSDELYREALILAVAGIIIGTPPAQLAAWYAMRDFVTSDIPSVLSVISSILAYIFIADTFFFIGLTECYISNNSIGFTNNTTPSKRTWALHPYTLTRSKDLSIQWLRSRAPS